MGISNEQKAQAAASYFVNGVDVNVPVQTNLSYTRLATNDSMTGKFYNYLVGSEMPVLNIFEGSPEAGSLRIDAKVIEAVPYQKKLDMDLSWILGNEPQVVRAKIDQFLATVDSDKEAIIANAMFKSGLRNGTTATLFGMDDLALFSTSHPNGPSGAVQSNLLTAKFSALALTTAVTAHKRLRDANGTFYDNDATVLTVGPKYEVLANNLLQSAYGSIRGLPINASGVEASTSVVAVAGVSNAIPVLGLKLQINKYFDEEWTVSCDSKSLKPLILATQGGGLMRRTNMDSNEPFRLPVAEFQVVGGMAVGIGPWNLIIGSDGSA